MSSEGPANMRDVARKAGVSVSAVSLALRGSHKISAGRRQQILKIAEKFGYRPDPRVSELMAHLRTPRSERPTSEIAVIVPGLSREELQHYPPITEMIRGIREIADRTGFAVVPFFLTDPGMTEERIRAILLARGIKGLIYAPFHTGVAKVHFNFDGFCAATAGYSIIEPRLSRACPNYLQMMDETLVTCMSLGYRRIGLIMTYGVGGIGHKLFTSSYLFFRSNIPEEDHIPILQKGDITPANLERWLAAYKPDVVISAASVYQLLCNLGVRIPKDIGFTSIDLSETPTGAAGADHRYQLVGKEAFQLIIGALQLNVTGVPADPKIVLVDSHQKEGFTLVPRRSRKMSGRSRATEQPGGRRPNFRGFLD